MWHTEYNSNLWKKKYMDETIWDIMRLCFACNNIIYRHYTHIFTSSASSVGKVSNMYRNFAKHQFYKSIALQNVWYLINFIVNIIGRNHGNGTYCHSNIYDACFIFIPIRKIYHTYKKNIYLSLTYVFFPKFISHVINWYSWCQRTFNVIFISKTF